MNTPGDVQLDRLVGRDEELAALSELVRGLAAGRGGLVWLRGEPGSGKSELLNAVAAYASVLGITVFLAAADESSRLFPLQLMAECLRFSKPYQQMTAERMMNLVRSRSEAGPVLLAIDDLQWADKASIRLWSQLGRTAAESPLLLIGSARPSPQRPELDQFARLAAGSAGLHIELGPLDEESVAELASQVVGGPLDRQLRAALCQAGGNPRYVRELATALVREPLAHEDGAIVEFAADPGLVPRSLAVAVDAHLGSLPAGARNALRLAALLGATFDLKDWAIVTNQPVIEICELARVAADGGVLCTVGDQLRFRHELVRQVLASQIPLALRHALHSDFAWQMAHSGRTPRAVAGHILAGQTDSPPAWMLDWLITVPVSALYTDPRLWATLLVRITDVVSRSDSRWARLASQLARVQFWLGQDELAVRTATAVLQQVGAGGGDAIPIAASMRELLIRSSDRRQRPMDGMPVMVSAADDELPPAWRARLTAWSAVLLAGAGQTITAAAKARRAQAMAASVDDAVASTAARHALAICGGPTCQLDDAKASRAKRGPDDRRSSAGDSPDSADLGLLVAARQISLAAEFGYRQEAEILIAEAMPLAADDAHVDQVETLHEALVCAAAADFCYRYGQWDDALTYSARIAASLRPDDLLSSHRGLKALIALHRYDQPAADQLLSECVGSTPLRHLTQALALRAEFAGDIEGAVGLLSAWLTAPPRDQASSYDDMVHLTRLTLALADHVTAESAATVCQDAANRVASESCAAPGQVAAARFCRALIGNDTAELLGTAATYRKLGWPAHAALALEEAAARLAEGGHSAQARTALSQSTKIRSSLGASRVIRQADARLRQLGVRRGPLSSHRQATSGWAALTPAEERVAALVASGMSNPEIARELFLSPRTVRTHVSSILAKLQLSSRLEIIRAAHIQR